MSSTISILNRHQEYWQLSVEEKDEKKKYSYKLAAAALGHYRAYASVSEDDQKLLLAVLENQEMQSWKHIYDDKGRIKEDNLGSEIVSVNQNLIEEIVQKKKLPEYSEIMCILSSSPVSFMSRIMYYLSHKVRILAKAVFGVNNFLEISSEKRAVFANVLAQAEKGEAPSASLNPLNISDSVKGMPGSHQDIGAVDHKLSFAEHRTANDEGNLLEMLQVSKNTKNQGAKILFYTLAVGQIIMLFQ